MQSLNRLEKVFYNNPDEKGILVFNNKFPSLIVLQKLISITDLAVTKVESYPNVSQSTIKEIIKCVIGKDERTIQSYLETIRLFVVSKTGKQIGYYSSLDLSGFYQVLSEAQAVRKEQKAKKDQLKRESEKARAWCPTCRQHKRKDGGCYC